MTPEQLQQFEDAIVAAVDQHLAKGGTIRGKHFGFMDTIKCPIACLLGNKPSEHQTIAEAVSEAVYQKLGFDINGSDVWGFIGGFDDATPGFCDSATYQLGQKLRKRYLP